MGYMESQVALGCSLGTQYPPFDPHWHPVKALEYRRADDGWIEVGHTLVDLWL